MPDGRIIRTIGEAAEYATSLPRKIGNTEPWQRAAKVLHEAAEHGGGPGVRPYKNEQRTLKNFPSDGHRHQPVMPRAVTGRGPKTPHLDNTSVGIMFSEYLPGSESGRGIGR
jgi:hypothetical protein